MSENKKFKPTRMCTKCNGNDLDCTVCEGTGVILQDEDNHETTIFLDIDSFSEEDDDLEDY